MQIQKHFHERLATHLAVLIFQPGTVKRGGMKPSNKLRQVEKLRPEAGSQTLSPTWGGEVGIDTLTSPHSPRLIPGDKGYVVSLANKPFEVKEPQTSNNYDLLWPTSESLACWHH